ncbi:MAG: DUF1292 domain-containing protein [Lachnospiraceae bacterium]|jgi:Protein of unknown function (DUF1292).|nr:DUF1292 domain-containing protein [Lachnospiraceae bacterium]MCI8826547.1 DUF1292 domain-containing protein [Lachnospiraceae bacterium]MCI9369065.1 DUF1292 domain-containing protein [Lachnospiraceae bacterium]MDE7308477.1 DUF1292 domain-containing protein [Lachnospiraceae bacterium]
MFGKIKFVDEEGTELEFSVIEQTRVNNINYLLVTDSGEEEEEIEAFIVKDLSAEEDKEALYEIVEDEDEFEGVAKIFDELVGDLD